MNFNPKLSSRWLSLHEVRSFLHQAEVAVGRIDRGSSEGGDRTAALREAIARCAAECDHLLHHDSGADMPTLFELAAAEYVSPQMPVAAVSAAGRLAKRVSVPRAG